ncbi:MULTISPECIES: deoxyguanosinetriphosphate triphosphohydrolase [Nocardiopsis]|uniref:Deoxyguanosinetriphosphate triphosphohydrolase-like protein n=1 Tax=Nocardiopsis changdeensis TaxID=2831969 RepID=A0ABX8BHZ9_9ACTN|nr:MULTISPECIES: deoxyguanosinetriphosphate triphosphohydrolase [Nocardiopsis]QUX21385.1 deoxyguanosinetriphosphate triphosphohydrolase [Nocardiopsis changdeensis]QYX37316.1 deoxyguanosinetriphosphate triphosphohydrolase [Nocardiopsis sp. MT53]
MHTTSGAEGAVAGYTGRDIRRRTPENRKNRARGPFERDRARVLHSSALRRLAAKTQVVRPGVSDFPRTRLTHSLECAQIGRELGNSLGCDPDLVEAACLSHDLGHPPFGHNGERALDEAAADCGGFEGNAQSLRLLVRLEGKVIDPDGTSAGLNLTRATLDATVKYPWHRGGGGDTHKFNCYPDDADAFAWLREGAPAGRTCFEAQVMDWSDDVAYSVHDVEDALHAGLVSMAALRSPAERAEVVRIAADRYCDTADPAELDEVYADLLAAPVWPTEFTGDLASLAGLKNLTSELIGRFCRAAEQATREAHGPGRLTRYGATLIVPRRALLECALLKAVAAHFVMAREEALAYQARERLLITELVDALWKNAPQALDPQFRDAFTHAPDDAAALRAVIDQVASLTDTSAIALHERLTS